MVSVVLVQRRVHQIDGPTYHTLAVATIDVVVVGTAVELEAVRPVVESGVPVVEAGRQLLEDAHLGS